MRFLYRRDFDAHATNRSVRATEEDKLPLGIFYINNNNPTFEENLKLDKEPFYTKKFNKKELAKLIASRR